MADNLIDVMGRLGQLEVQAQKKGDNTRVTRKRVESVHFGDPNQQGSYLLIPLPNPVYGATPYVLLNGVKQFKVSKKFGDKSYPVTRKILPTNAYDVIEPSTGKIFSSLTNEDLALHKEASALWDDLYRKMGGYKKQTDRTDEEKRMLMDPNRGIGTKNYTIFNGYVVNRYEGNNLRKVIKSNYGALIVVPSAAMIQSISENIMSISQMNYGGSNDWLNNIYNFDTTRRMGSIMLNVIRQTGYKITVTHSVQQQPIEINMNDEEREQMANNPVENFIGFSNVPQGEISKDPGQRKLFSQEYYKEMIEELKTLNAEFDGGYQNVAQAQAVPTRGPIQGSVDPILTQQSQAPMQNNFSQPQAAHIDPIMGQTGAPNNGGSGFPGFGQPTFNNPFVQQSPEGTNGDLPF